MLCCQCLLLFQGSFRVNLYTSHAEGDLKGTVINCTREGVEENTEIKQKISQSCTSLGYNIHVFQSGIQLCYFGFILWPYTLKHMYCWCRNVLFV